MTIPCYTAEVIARALDYPGCIAAMRAAMIGLSGGGRPQPLRQIMEMAPGHLFALMPGTLGCGDGADRGFGVKVITVFADNDRPGRARHQGLILLFDPVTGAAVCMGDAEAITHIRTACATAAATDALARPDATTLGLFGCGAQARSHLAAIALVRPIEEVRIWGRDPERVAAFIAGARATTSLRLRAVADPRDAGACDIVCTVTGSPTPVLHGAWVGPGTHVNLVGSSYAGPVECDTALVAKSRFIVDSRRSAMAAAAEFIAAKAAGVIDDGHVAGEIGDVFSGVAVGRRDSADITLYKSLGHIVQDLTALAYVHDRQDHQSA